MVANQFLSYSLGTENKESGHNEPLLHLDSQEVNYVKEISRPLVTWS